MWEYTSTLVTSDRYGTESDRDRERERERERARQPDGPKPMVAPRQPMMAPKQPMVAPVGLVQIRKSAGEEILTTFC